MTTVAGAVRRLVTTAVEHPSILGLAEELARRGADVVTLAVDRIGRIDRDELDVALAGQRCLAAVQRVNSETGVLQPVPEIAERCRRRDTLLHVDAAQAAGRVPIDAEATGLDFLAFSGHKLHGPQGTGVLYMRDPETLVPLLRGSDQEAGHRARTENLPGIAGLARACEIRAAEFGAAVARMRALRDGFERRILADVEDVVSGAESRAVRERRGPGRVQAAAG